MLQDSDNGFIGDIKYSIIEPGIFQQEHPGWVLLDGRGIDTNAKLGLLGFTKLPDARGIFLRGMNENRDNATGDAEGNRPIGSFQKDDFKEHTHEIETNASGGTKDGVARVANALPRPIISSSAGSLETRPRNISLYIYIKIDELSNNN